MKRSLPFIVVGLPSLLLTVIIAWFIFKNRNSLTDSGFGIGAYYILLIMLAMVASIFLFGLLKSTGTLSGKSFGIEYEFGGPAALFAAVVLLGLFLVKDQDPTDFNLVVRLGPDNANTLSAAFGPKQVTAALLSINVGQFPKKEHLDDNGQVLFPQIPFRQRNSEVEIRLDSDAFIFKEPKISHPIPAGRDPVITLVVIPKPKKEVQVAIVGPKLIRAASGGTSDGHSPFCQPHSNTDCVTPQHGGKLIVGSGGLTNMARNSPVRGLYRVTTDTPEQICVEVSSSTAACETEIFIQGNPSAVEQYSE
jgi:hypothetical protein